MGRILTLFSPEISELRFHNKLNNSTYTLLCVTSCHQILFVFCIKQLEIKMNGQLIVLSIVYIFRIDLKSKMDVTTCYSSA